MSTTKRFAPAILIMALALALVVALNPLTALAWDSSTQGNNEGNNSSEIEGSASGETAVEGWIGTFDGTEDPNRPDPPTNAWVNVKIPTTALFGSLSTDKGAIYSPVYHIYNQSARGVTITPTAFNVRSEPTELAGMELNLSFTQPNALTVPLRSTGNAFLGSGLTSPGSISLGAGSEASPTTATFTMSGQLPEGFAYPTDSPYKPNYGLVFTFTAEGDSPSA